MAISKSIPALLLACSGMLASPQTRATHPRPAETTQDRSADDLKEAEDLLQKQQYQQAAEKLLIVVDRDEKNPQGWFDLGFAQSHLNKSAEAIAAYRKAVELSPKWFEAQQNLGLALARSGDLPGAATALKVAVTLKPTTGGPKALSGAWVSLAQVTEES